MLLYFWVVIEVPESIISKSSQAAGTDMSDKARATWHAIN